MIIFMINFLASQYVIYSKQTHIYINISFVESYANSSLLTYISSCLSNVDPIIFPLNSAYLILLSSDSPKCIRKIKKPFADWFERNRRARGRPNSGSRVESSDLRPRCRFSAFEVRPRNARRLYLSLSARFWQASSCRRRATSAGVLRSLKEWR